MANNDAKRVALFKRGAEALRRYLDLSEDLYFCPVCRREFSETHLRTKQLTLEHVPPRSRGGRSVALTCEECNRTAGHSADGAATQSHHLWQLTDALLNHRGSHAGHASIAFVGRRIRVWYEIRDGMLTVSPLKGNDPRTVAAFMEHWRGPEGRGLASGTGLTFTPAIRFDSWQARVGALRAAYLAAFAKLGYTYAFDARLRHVCKGLTQSITATSGPRRG